MVLELQAALFEGKGDGFTKLDGLSRMTWKEKVALADVLQGMFWTVDEQQTDFDRYALAVTEESPEARNDYGGRYGALRFLAWLTEGWPHGIGPALGQRLVKRWLTCSRST